MLEYSEEFMTVARTLDNEMGGTVSIIADLIGDNSPSYGELADLQDMAFKRFIADNKDRIFSRLFEFYRPIWDAFEKIGWNVERDYSIVTLGNYSPAGEELIETLYLDDKANIPDQMYLIYDEFDEEEHATMWIDAKRNGTQGIPSIMRLARDAEDITDMYIKLVAAARESYSYCTEEK